MAFIVGKYEVQGAAGIAALNDDKSFTVNVALRYQIQYFQKINDQIGSI